LEILLDHICDRTDQHESLVLEGLVILADTSLEDGLKDPEGLARVISHNFFAIDVDGFLVILIEG
jgi:hypothetical protein